MSSAGWPALKEALDKLPVFTVANEEGKPLEYEVDGKQSAIFYADVEAAKNELKAAQGQYPDLNCDLIPVGLGTAFPLTCEGKATLVPGMAELQAAGAPAGAPAVGQTLPLFACMEMSREQDGKPILPLFMSHADCVQAVKQASEADGEDGLEIVGLSLPSVVDRLSSTTESAFTFVSPTASSKYITDYLQG